VAGIYTDASIQRLRDALDIVRVVESYVPLKRAGSRYKALCPFHAEKTPSFTVHPEMQLYKCFGCGEGGDVFKFVMKMDGLSFPEAVELLAERTGIALDRVQPRDKEQARGRSMEKKQLYWVCSKATAFFEEQLARASHARRYVVDRGFTDETISAWRLGWAPPRSTGLLEYLVRAAGGKREAVSAAADKAGLVRKGSSGLYDFFQGRIMFPILDTQHRPIAFGGRVLKEEPGVGKYMNSPETPLFSKSRVLFALDAAAREIRLTKTAVVVEGYTDAIMCHQHGLRNVVATLGTALTAEHVRLLRRYADTVIARFDADEAGDRATDRAIRAFVEQDLPLRVVRSTQIKDACEFLPRQGADAFRAELDKAEDAFSYHIRRSFEGRELGNVDERTRAVRQAMEVVNLSPDPLKQDMLRQTVASTAGVSVQSLPQPTPRRSTRGARERKGEPAAKNEGPPAELEPRLRAERWLLGYMLRRRDWCDAICRVKPPEEFGTELHREVAEEIHDAWGELDRLTTDVLLTRLQHPEAGSLLSELAFDRGPEPTEEALAEGLYWVRLRDLEEEIGSLEREIREAKHAEAPEGVDALMVRLIELKRELEELRQEKPSDILDGSAA